MCFFLFYEGIPVITKMSKKRSTDGKNKVLTCEAEGSPQPDVQWSVNGTNVSFTPTGLVHMYKCVIFENISKPANSHQQCF